MAIVTPLEDSGAQESSQTAAETGAEEPRRYALTAPGDLAPLGELVCTSDAEVEAAVANARDAQPGWAALGISERSAYMDRARGALVRRRDEIVDIIVAESGKARSDAIMIDIYSTCDSFAYWAKHAEKALKPHKLPTHGILRVTRTAHVEYRALGVVGVISPWNGPLILSMNPSVQALMAGNAVIAKPSEVTPASALVAAELFEEAGLPDGVFQMVAGDAKTGAALVDSGVDKISFTGSVATGRKIAEACARKLIPCSLELGGKDAMLVLDDADIERAAGGAVAGGMINTGQYCCGTERIYVEESVADEFTELVVAKVAALRQSNTGEFDVGAVCQARQVEIIEDHVRDAVERGAEVRAGGRRNPNLDGLFYEPTVVTGAGNDMRIMREETFGPVVAIARVKDTDEAVELANDSGYGLSGTVWSRDVERATAVARRLQTGSVCINDMPMVYGMLEAPFGGLKDSGVGRVNGANGPRDYCHALPIIVDRFGGKQAATHYPYTTKQDKIMMRMIKIVWGTPLGRWLS